MDQNGVNMILEPIICLYVPTWHRRKSLSFLLLIKEALLFLIINT